jgi:hypothetical protein
MEDAGCRWAALPKARRELPQRRLEADEDEAVSE